MTFRDYVIAFTLGVSIICIARNVWMSIAFMVTYHVYLTKDTLIESIRTRIMDEVRRGATVIGLASTIVYLLVRFW